jgi:hypothetical protein
MSEDTLTTADTSTETEQPTDTQTTTAKAKTYTKAEVDGMVKKAQLAVRKEIGDVLEYKTKAEQFDALQESSKSEEAKLRERADKMTRERDAALTRSRSTLIRSAIISVASRLGSVDPEAVASLLPHDELIVEGDEVIGVEEAVKALLAKKSYLRAGATRAGTEMGGGGQEPTVITRSQIRKWAREGELTPERISQIDAANKAGKILQG